MRSRSQKSKKQNKKENKIIFQKAYLDDPEYRTFLVKLYLKEDKDMEQTVDELAKLFSSLSED